MDILLLDEAVQVGDAPARDAPDLDLSDCAAPLWPAPDLEPQSFDAPSLNLTALAAPASQVPTAVMTAPARLLRYDREREVALAVHTTLELLENAKVVELPGAAYYCTGLTKWQGRWLPVIDLHVLVHAYRKEYAPKARYLLVVAYQSAPRAALRHGAISLPAMPETVDVSDNASCPLPNDSDLWPLLALSCFSHEARAVPILDTARLFAGYHG